MSESVKPSSDAAKILSSAKSIYFIGVGGVSMSSLARVALSDGLSVGGSDRTPSQITDELRAAGVRLNIGHSAENVEGWDAVVYNAAIHEDNPERMRAAELNIPQFRRAEYLGYVMLRYQNRIGIAGMHGKSTTTSMAAHLLCGAGIDASVECGAVMPEFGGAMRDGSSDTFVFEACEYTDSFLSFYPTVAVVLNIAPEHLDYFSGMDHIRKSFRKYIDIAGKAVVNFDCADVRAVCDGYAGTLITYALGREADYTAKNIRYEGGFAHFDIAERGMPLCSASLAVPGEHNISNALAACACARLCGVSGGDISRLLATFTGCHRRFEKVGQTQNGVPVYDDYAHHPDEIRATLAGVRRLGYKRILTIFQPHTYSRTATLYDDFKKAFGDTDLLYICDIFAAREVNSYGVSSQRLAADTGAVYCDSFADAARRTAKEAKPGDIILTMGAGDVYKAGLLLVK
ncbi:MAG: UDP-N-acetylmuramate--L-alanine ligase [Eubacteriales bacterium]